MAAYKSITLYKVFSIILFNVSRNIKSIIENINKSIRPLGLEPKY